jgi:hypothetical protein
MNWLAFDLLFLRLLVASAVFLRPQKLGEESFGNRQDTKIRLRESATKVWIVTADTEPLSPLSAIQTGKWMDLMAVSVFHWAKRHGYGYTRYTYEFSDPKKTDINRVCSHPVFGERHASWCKLLVVGKLMKELSQTVELLIWYCVVYSANALLLISASLLKARQ